MLRSNILHGELPPTFQEILQHTSENFVLVTRKTIGWDSNIDLNSHNYCNSQTKMQSTGAVDILPSGQEVVDQKVGSVMENHTVEVDQQKSHDSDNNNIKRNNSKSITDNTTTTPTKIPTAAINNRTSGIPPRSETFKQVASCNMRRTDQTPNIRLNGLNSSAKANDSRLSTMKSSQPSNKFSTATSRTLSMVKPSLKSGLPASRIVTNIKTPKSTSLISNNNTINTNNNNSSYSRNQNSNFVAPKSTREAIRNTSHKAAPTNSTLVTPCVPIKSRSSSIVSSVSSVATAQPISSNTNTSTANTVHPPATQRKGLAKFSNPIECQRQFQTLSLKIRKLNEIVEAREKEQDILQEKLDRASLYGTGYAVVAQYFATQLKLDQSENLMQECKNLKLRLEELLIREGQVKERELAIIDEYNQKLKTSNDLKDQISKELELATKEHSDKLEEINKQRQKEIDDLNGNNQLLKERLESRISELESDLNAKSTELTELRENYCNLKHNYDHLEESLTKDKDSRMKYAQERITQLQKDVESLTTVMEMRQERLHQLEKDNLGYLDCQNELKAHKEVIKSLNQQLESINAALDRKREQFKNLLCENERLKQELELENKERRRIKMRTEQLEYVLNESCSSDTASNFNTSVTNSSVMLSTSPRSQTFEAS